MADNPPGLYTTAIYQRNLIDELLASLKVFPVVLIVGARQVGKTTLARQMVELGLAEGFASLDNATVLANAISDPDGFIDGLPQTVVIDEVQRVPQLLLAIKASVDRERRPGRFILTGSADVFLAPNVADSLTGRMAVLPLWPLAQSEILGGNANFVERLFATDQEVLQLEPLERSKFFDLVMKGGFPEAVAIKDRTDRARWFDGYLDSVLQRDIPELARIELIADLPRLARLTAARATGLVNKSEFSNALGIAQTTLRRYLALLSSVFFVTEVPAWYRNIGQRLIKAPKLLLTDTGLLAHLNELSTERLIDDPSRAGALVENFVGVELLKQIGWLEHKPTLFHFRTQRGVEVDYLIQDRSGRVAAIEVKAGQTVDQRALRGLKMLAEHVGSDFVRGVVLYGGSEVHNFGGGISAWPIQTLWDRT